MKNQHENGKPAEIAGEESCYEPTFNLQWFEASNEEESGPCASNLRAHAECGKTGYVLRQWWTNGKTGQWRNIETAYNNEPPKLHNKTSST